MTVSSQVHLGSDRLIASGRLAGRRVGLVSNPASVDAEFRHIADRLGSSDDTSLATLFGPQHGFHAVVQDNMVETAHTRHTRHDVPVYSLYSDTRKPTAEMLEGLDVIVIDLQDVGTRVYTYIYTMANCLRAAKHHGLSVIVCDRPNPIGGAAVEGPMLHEGFESFIGQCAIPLRHGMTIGELAQLFNTHFEIGADLEVVPMTGWTRSMYADQTGLPWIIPSPNLPTLDSAIVYPGGVLFEGTNVSEGRGTTRPFELIGAPWVDADALCQTLTAEEIPGVLFRPVQFEPTFQKHVDHVCGGCQIHVRDRHTFPPVKAAVAVMQAMRRQGPSSFEWKDPPYEYEEIKVPIDILSGSDTLRKQIETDLGAAEIADSWVPDIKAFERIRRGCLRYE